MDTEDTLHTLRKFVRYSAAAWEQRWSIFAYLYHMTIMTTLLSIVIFELIMLVFSTLPERDILFSHYAALFMVKTGISDTVTLSMPHGPLAFMAEDAVRITQPGADKFTIFLRLAKFVSIGAGVFLAVQAMQARRAKERKMDELIWGTRTNLSGMTMQQAKTNSQIVAIRAPDAIPAPTAVESKLANKPPPAEPEDPPTMGIF